MNEDTKTFPLRLRGLLAIHLIIPFLVLIAVADVYYFNSSLLPYMGFDSLLLPLYLLIFELPHIIASFFGFLDKEYIHHYRKHLFVYLPGVLGVVAFLMWQNFAMLFILYLVATMYHVIRQQTGITSLFRVRRNWFHSLWSWSAIVATSLMYIEVVVPQVFARSLTEPVSQLFGAVILFGMFLFSVSSVMLLKQAESALARWYIFLTALTIWTGYLFIGGGYLFFGFFAIRFVHDVTAFYFYIVHDVNRNREQRTNFLYRLFSKVPVPVVVLVPVLAIGFSYLLRNSIVDNVDVLLAIIILFASAHYYLESIMWKRDSIHRKQLSVTN